jgi:predicted O-methyltransferase YrrM
VASTLDRVEESGSLVSRTDGSTHHIFPVSVPFAEGRALRERVVQESAGRTIEVGLGYGISALFICDGLLAAGNPDGRHVAIDPNQLTRFAGCGLQLLDDAGVCARVEHLAEESEIALPRLLAAGRRFDFAFVDGNHRFDGVFLDLVYLGRLLEPGSIVMVDDFQLPAVQAATRFCVTNLGWSPEEASTEDHDHHWAALRTSRSADRRPHDHFVSF